MAKKFFDSKEYTKQRDIAQKRMKRAYSQGLSEYIHIPTIKEIKSGLVNPEAATRALKNYLSGGSTVTAIKQTGLVPEFRKFQQLPEERPLTESEKQDRRRQQARSYRQRKRIREGAKSPENAKRRISYLKALDTFVEGARRQGKNLGIDVSSMSPKEAAAFAAYMDYRFAQGDFTQKYVVDEFIHDYVVLKSQGHKPENIMKDFAAFVKDQLELEDEAAAMDGLSKEETRDFWFDFVGDERLW